MTYNYIKCDRVNIIDIDEISTSDIYVTGYIGVFWISIKSNNNRHIQTCQDIIHITETNVELLKKYNKIPKDYKCITYAKIYTMPGDLIQKISCGFCKLYMSKNRTIFEINGKRINCKNNKNNELLKYFDFDNISQKKRTII